MSYLMNTKQVGNSWILEYDLNKFKNIYISNNYISLGHNAKNGKTHYFWLSHCYTFIF